MSILIVGDRKHARRSLAALLRASLPRSEVREAASASEAVGLAGGAPPRVVVLDVPAPDAEGLRSVREIRCRWPDARILVLTLHRCGPDQAAVADADAVVSKSEPPDRLLSALSALL